MLGTCMGRLPDPRTVGRRPLVHPEYGRNGVWKCPRLSVHCVGRPAGYPGTKHRQYNAGTVSNMLGRQHKVHASTQHDQTAYKRGIKCGRGRPLRCHSGAGCALMTNGAPTLHMPRRLRRAPCTRWTSPCLRPTIDPVSIVAPHRRRRRIPKRRWRQCTNRARWPEPTCCGGRKTCCSSRRGRRSTT